MLQWTGGSRQKVNASRGSKEKRQKQYFEQRKRQQHQHISSADNFVYGYNTDNLNQKAKRSLDILSLHSILEADTLPDRSPKTRTLPKLSHKLVRSANNVETLHIPESGNISNNPEPRMPEEEIGTCRLHNAASEGDPEGKELKHAESHQFEDMSIFELVDEDGDENGKSRNKSEENTEYEAHVAFSMQGLGKVRTETPVNSPQPSRRILPDGQSSLFKAARHQYSCRNFDNLLDDHEIDMESMMENGDLFSNGKYLSSESWRFDSYGHAKPDCLKDKNIEMYDNNPRATYFHDKENSDDIQEMHASFLEDRTLFSEKFDMSWDNSRFTDIYNISTHEADFTEDFSYGQRDQIGRTGRFCKDQNERTGRFWYSDFSSQHPKHQLAEDCDFLESDNSNESYFIANKFTKAGAKQSRYSYLKEDNPMDNLSSFSGESCSSSAVKGGGFAGVHTARRKTLKRNTTESPAPNESRPISPDFT